MAQWIELFDGLMKGSIPFGGGGYVCYVHFANQSNYAIIEVIGFRNVKNIFRSESGVNFQSDGYKIYILYEPLAYSRKHVEPYLREDHERIPLRWNELHIVNLPRRDRVFLSREPYVSHGSFNVEAPEQGSFVYYIFDNDKVHKNLETFVFKVLEDDLKIGKASLETIRARLHENLVHFQDSVSHSS